MTPPRRPLEALRHRDFALLWSGQSVSLIGDGIFVVTLALEALRLDSRPQGLALVIAARLLPTVGLVLLGGVAVDRMPRRLAMLVSDVTRGLAVAAIAYLTATGRATLWELIVMSVVFGAADAIFYPASTAVVPELLPRDLLVQASALSSTSRTVTQSLIGPALGGLVVAALGTAWGFGLDAVSFAVSAACLVLMRARPRPAPSGRSILADAGEGLRYSRTQPWLWVTILAAGLANFIAFSPQSVLTPLLVRHVLRLGALALGLALAAKGAGGLVSALLVARMGAPRLRITAMWLAWGMGGAASILLGVAPSIWVAGVALFLVSGLMMYGNVLWEPLLQDLVPPEMLGRASSIDWMFSIFLSPLGVVAAGYVAAAIGTRQAILIGGAVVTLLAGVIFLPRVRDPERRFSE